MFNLSDHADVEPNPEAVAMKYYLKEWQDDDYVTVIDERGQVMGNFISVEDAIDAYDWFDSTSNDIYSDGLSSADASTIGL